MPKIKGKASATLRALALAALVVGLAAAGPEKRSTITNVSLQEIGGATQLNFSADKSVTCESVESPDPKFMIVDVKGANNTLPRMAALTSPAISGLRTDMWHTEDGTPVTRITIELAGNSRTWLEPQDRGFTVMIEPVTPANTPAAGQAVIPPAGTDPPPAVSEMAERGVNETDQPGSETWGEVTIEGSVETPASADVTASSTESVHAPVQTMKGSLAESNAAEMETTTEPSPVREFLSSRPQTFEPKSLSSTQRYADGGSRVSLDVQGADIRTVMRSLSEYSGTNVVVGRDVSGTVTVNLNEVPWVDALNTICRTQGLGWVEEEGIIRVETLDNLRKEDVSRSTADKQLEDLQPLTTQIVRAVYATATELKPAIEKTLTERGHVEVDPRTNSLVITDVSRRVSAAVEMVTHLDSRTPQIEITAKLVDVDARFTRDLGINWGLGQLHSNDQAASGEVDVKTLNVIDPAAAVKFGLVRSWGTINAMLSALEQDNKADIISNPRITTVNNREARILVGRKIPLIVLDEAGNAVTQLTTIGITLRVTPHINDDDRITLDLHPEVSDLAGQATVQGGIIINTSEADTRVIVDDGETAVIGGLIRTNTSKLRRGVPILKDIPLLGYLFSGTTEVKEKRELLIFITPKIITNWAQTNSAHKVPPGGFPPTRRTRQPGDASRPAVVFASTPAFFDPPEVLNCAPPCQPILCAKPPP
jgi:type IV pilus assembly protein PilQ